MALSAQQVALPSIGTNEHVALSHVPRRVGPGVQRRISALQVGDKMQDLPEELWHDSFRFYVKMDPTRRGGPNLRLIRLDPNKPSLTVTGYVFNKFVHPFEDRFITPREAARLQDFDDTFRFLGNLTSVQRQVGNAVPPRLALAVAKAVMQHATKHGTLDEWGGGEIPSVSLFTGVGGLDEGFGRLLDDAHGVRFRPMLCVEFDRDCVDTLQSNGLSQQPPMDVRSISDPAGMLEQVTGLKRVPLVVGGPPCQSFSQAGRQRSVLDDRGVLVFEFARFVRAVEPTYFVMENVSNLKGVDGGQVFARLLETFHDLGYAVTPWKLCAADYGTAQLRKRWFLVGVRDGLPAVAPPEASHCDPGTVGPFATWLTPYRTVGEAFTGLPSLA